MHSRRTAGGAIARVDASSRSFIRTTAFRRCPPPQLFVLDVNAAEETLAAKPASERTTWKTRSVQAAILARVAGEVCGVAAGTAPPRLVIPTSAATDALASSTVMHLEAAASPPAAKAKDSAHHTDVVAQFALVFACTLHMHRSSIFGSDVGLTASGSDSIAPAPAVASRSRVHIAEVNRASHLCSLQASLCALCLQARPNPGSEGTDDKTKAAHIAKKLIESMDATAIASGGQLRRARWRARQQHQHQEGPVVKPGDIHDTIGNVLQRTLWELQLAISLFDEAYNNTLPASVLNSKADRSWCALVGEAMLLRIFDSRHVFSFHDVSGRSPKLVKINGFSPFLLHCWEYAYASSTRGGYTSAADYQVNSAIQQLLAQVMALLPTWIAHSSNNRPELGHKADAHNKVHDSLRILQGLNRSLQQKDREVRWKGSHAAMHWLRLVPAVLAGLTGVMERRLCLAADPAGGSDESRILEAALLSTAQKELSQLLSKLAFSDSSAYAAEESPDAADSTGDKDGENNNDGIEEDANETDDAPLKRKRGKRSLFYKGDDASARVLLPEKASRFSVRHNPSASTQAGDNNASSPPGDQCSALFQAVVLSNDMPAFLEEHYSIFAKSRHPTLEKLWLEIIHGMRGLQRLLYSSPHSVYELNSGDAANGPLPQQSSATPPKQAAFSSVHVPLALQPLYEAKQPTKATRRQQERVARILVESQSAIALGTFDALLRVSDRISMSLVRIHRQVSDRADLKKLPSHRMHEERRRVLGFYLVLGSRELVWSDSSLWHGANATWALRLSPGSSFPQQRPDWLEAARLLSNRFAVEQSWTASRLRSRRHELLECAREALRSFGPITSEKGRSSGKKVHTRAPLNLVNKQLAAALIVSNLNIIAIVRSRGAIEPALLHEATELHRDLLNVLSTDAELLVACSYPAFLHALNESHLRLSTDGESIARFADNHLLPIALPMIARCLEKSKAEDAFTGHALLCETTLPLLAELARYGASLQVSQADAMRTTWNDVLMRLSIYCIRMSGRGGLRRASDFNLPPAALPSGVAWWSAETQRACADLMPYILPTPTAAPATTPSGYRSWRHEQGNLLQFLDMSNGLFHYTRMAPTYQLRVECALDMLQEFHRALRRDVPLAELLAENPSSSSLAPTASLPSRLIHHHEAMQRWSAMVGAAQVAAAKRTTVIAQGDPFQVHVQGYLVRFLNYITRHQERGTRDHEKSLVPLPVRPVDDGEYKVMNASLYGSPLVLLEYIGFLSFSGSWAMVCWAVNVAETAVWVEMRRDRHAVSTVRDVAVTAVLAQLRAVPPPSQNTTMSTILVKSLCTLADMLSRDGSATLLGFDRRNRLTGMLSSPSRDEYRSLLYAVKQVSLYAEMESHKYRHAKPAAEGLLANEGEEEDVDVMVVKDEAAGEPTLSYYDQLRLMAAAEEVDPSALHTYNYSYRYYLDCLLSAIDLNLECVRHHVLLQGVLADDLRDVLAASFQSLCRILTDLIDTFLALPENSAKSNNNGGGVGELFAKEYSELLWIGLCAVATMAHACHLDHTGTFFTNKLMRYTDNAVKAVERLSLRVPGERVLSVLQQGVSLQSGDSQASQRVTIRMAIAQRGRTDPTAIIMAFYALATHGSQFAATAGLFHNLWTAIQQQLLTTPGRTKGKKARSAQHGSAVVVPSLAELRLALSAFSDIDRMLVELKSSAVPDNAAEDASVGATRYQPQRAPLLSWGCDVDGILSSATEDPTLSWDSRREKCINAAAEDAEEAALLMEPSEWSLVFSTTHQNVSDALEDGSASLLELMDSVIQQGIQLKSAMQSRTQPNTPDNRPFLLPQLQRLSEEYLQNLIPLLNECSLMELSQRPNAAALFDSLAVFTDSRRLKGGQDKSASAQPMTESIECLWQLLTSKVQEELIRPQEETFLAKQRDLLQGIYTRRRSAANGNENPAANDMFTTSLGSGEVLSQAAKRCVGSSMREDAVLTHHDDTRGVPSNRTTTTAEEVAADGHNSQSYGQRLPVDIVVSLLNVLNRGDSALPGLSALAESVCVMAMRQYVLLRPRLDGTAINVVPVLALVGNKRQEEALSGWARLPVSSVNEAQVRGALFPPRTRASVQRAYESLGLLNDANYAASAEEHTSIYLRHACLYMQVLGALAAVMIRYGMSGTLADSLEAGVRLQLQRSQRHDVKAAPGDVDQSVSHHVRQEALTRQTTADGVNDNLLESCLLHILNVGGNLVRHTDSLTRMAIDREVQLAGMKRGVAVAAGSGGSTGDGHEEHPVSGASASFVAYATEMRSMVSHAVQDVFLVISRGGGNRGSFPIIVTRTVNYLISCCMCDAIPLDTALLKRGKNAPPEAMKHMLALQQWQAQRPEWFVGSPTMLEVISPQFILRGLSFYFRDAARDTIRTIACCLTAYTQRADASLTPLLEATAELLGSTNVRHASLNIYCELLCRELLRRDDFRLALAPPTLASNDQGSVAAVSNEVLIPFAAAMARQDVQISKKTLAELLHTVMQMRSDVFGQPPIANRQGKLSLVRASTVVGGSYDTTNPLYSSSQQGVVPSPSAASPKIALDEEAAGEAESEEDMAVLKSFAVGHSDATALTHRRALLGLNISLPATMDVIVHLRVMRAPSYFEAKQAKSMLLAADSARRERIGVYRSLVHAAPPSAADGSGDKAVQAASKQALDASLQLEDPFDYGVALLHLRFALTKVVHASYRRLAHHQGPRALADMTEALLDVFGTPSRSGPSPSGSPQYRDPMVAGTLRLLVSRALLCSQAVGCTETGSPLTYPDGASPVLTSLEPSSLSPRDARDLRQREAEAAAAVATTTTPHPPTARARIARALNALKRASRREAMNSHDNGRRPHPRTRG